MYKSLTFMFILCFVGAAYIIRAEAATHPFAHKSASNNHLPLPGDCPSDEILVESGDWVEHKEIWSSYLDSILEIHFSLPPAPIKAAVYFSLVPVYMDRGMGAFPRDEVVWTIYRTNQTNFSGKNNNCYLIGTVAYYVEVHNIEGWPPKAGLLNDPQIEEQKLHRGDIGLIELRWYDPVWNKRHRWFNDNLSSTMQWKEYNYSPISLPMAINTLY